MDTNKLWKKILCIVYPKRCLLCDSVLKYNDSKAICESCESKTKYLVKDLCKKCGKPHDTVKNDLCFDCSRKSHIYIEGRGMWHYTGDVKKAIYKYKYYGRRNYARLFAKELAIYYCKYINWDIDIITSVPLHPKKLKERSFNQSALIADRFGEIIGVKVDNNLLYRTKYTMPQKELSDFNRILNVENAFCANDKRDINECNILIIDDIYTTGSTIDSCAKVLKEHGASRIYFLTIAIGKGY